MVEKLNALAEALVDRIHDEVANGQHDIAETYSVILGRVHAILRELGV